MGDNAAQPTDRPPAGGVTPGSRGRSLLIAATMLAVGGGAAAYWWWPSPDRAPERRSLPDLAELNDDPPEPVAVRNPGYVGPQACAPCHAARVAEFLKTPHARACRRPQDGPMPPGFDPGRGHYSTGEPDLHFDMTREGGEFFQTAVQQTAAGERRTKSRIDLVYGANKADEVFFTWRGDRLYELMTVWLHPSDEWANTTYDRFGSGGFARETTARCLECHNTWFEHVPGTVNQYRPDSFVLGVTCERCHGPGSEHVKFHQSHPGEQAAHAIVHPGRLARARQTEVCTQCHGNSTKALGPGLSYRPGQPLAEYYRTAETRHPEEDHVANQVKYLQQSKCFQKTDSLTCVTCHDPHRPHDPADAGSARRSCAQCHQPDACTDRPNLPTAVRDDCVGCHMRRQVWVNVHFHTGTDRYLPPVRRAQHRIGKDPVARSEVLLAWHRSQPGEANRREADRLTAELAAHWLGEVESRRREYRFLAAIGAAREALRLDLPPAAHEQAAAALKEMVAIQSKLDADLNEALHEADRQRAGPAIEILNRILTVKPDQAVAHSKLGTLYAATGRIDQAKEHLEAVATHDPDNASGLAMLGWLAYLDDRAQDAIGFYRRADQIEPFDAQINYHWGLSLLKAGAWADAAERFRKVLLIDPNHAGGSQGLAHALRHEGRPAEAVRYAWRAARLTEFREPDVLVTLADAYADAGRFPEAAAAAAKAIESDRDGPGGLGFETRRRMEGTRARAGR
jgi:tetratricopeptide (TPR) repeat protein